MRFVISVRGEAREQYILEAPDEQSARYAFEAGDVGKPVVSEVEGAEIVAIDALPEPAPAV